MRTCIIIALAVVLAAASAVQASLTLDSLDWGSSKSKGMTLSVFAAVDKQSDESGFGVSLTQYQRQVTDFSFVDLDSLRLYQFSKLEPRAIGPIAANIGFTVAYADPKDANPSPDTPDNLLTGLSAVFAKSEIAMGLSFDLRASSLSKDFDPIAWFTDPDIFMIGAGLSYSF